MAFDTSDQWCHTAFAIDSSSVYWKSMLQFRSGMIATIFVHKFRKAYYLLQFTPNVTLCHHQQQPYHEGTPFKLIVLNTKQILSKFPTSDATLFSISIRNGLCLTTRIVAHKNFTFVLTSPPEVPLVGPESHSVWAQLRTKPFGSRVGRNLQTQNAHQNRRTVQYGSSYTRQQSSICII